MTLLKGYTHDGGANPDDDEFDEIVCAQQEILISPQFEKISSNFVENNCEMFEDVEENKHEYFISFKQYKNEVEKYLNTKLKEMVKGYDEKRFKKLLIGREDQIDEQIIETLKGFSDFLTFKEMMLEHKLYLASKNAKESVRESICFEKLIADTIGYDNMNYTWE